MVSGVQQPGRGLEGADEARGPRVSLYEDRGSGRDQVPRAQRSFRRDGPAHYIPVCITIAWTLEDTHIVFNAFPPAVKFVDPSGSQIC